MVLSPRYDGGIRRDGRRVGRGEMLKKNSVGLLKNVDVTKRDFLRYCKCYAGGRVASSAGIETRGISRARQMRA